jgi:hypothetical protein
MRGWRRRRSKRRIRELFKIIIIAFVRKNSLFVCLFVWRYGPTWAMASSFTRFLDRTQRRATVGRTSLDE